MITRTLGPEKFGYFTIFLATAQLFFCIFANWTRNSIIRFGSEAFAKEKDLGVIIGSQAIITFASFLLAITILFLMKNYLQGILGLGENSYLWVIMYLTAYILSDFILQFLRAIHRIRLYAAALFSRQVILVTLFGLLFTILRCSPYVSKIIALETVSYLFIFTFFFCFTFSRRRFFQVFSYSNKKIIEMLDFSWPVLIIVFLSYILLWADIWMIKFFLTYRAVGEYGAANRLMQLISNVIMPLSIVGFPLMVSLRSIGKDSAISAFAAKIVPQLCFFWSFVVLILLFSTKSIIHLLFGEKFISSIFTFQVLLAGVSFQILPVLYTSILQAYDWTKRMALIVVVSVIINLLLDFILIPRLGIIGAAVSKAFAFIICGILYTHSAFGCLKIKRANPVMYVFLLISPLALLFLYTLKNNFLLTAVIVFMCILSIIIVKKAQIFSQEAWSFWEAVKMPLFIHKWFKKIYTVFA
jgi:O-antigen/teichoic acid export membrane protein